MIPNPIYYLLLIPVAFELGLGMFIFSSGTGRKLNRHLAIILFFLAVSGSGLLIWGTGSGGAAGSLGALLYLGADYGLLAMLPGLMRSLFPAGDKEKLPFFWIGLLLSLTPILMFSGNWFINGEMQVI